MKAMILAAGFGTRLRPLSDRRPKSLVPVANQPVILRNLEYLRSHGVGEIVVNAHHHAGQIVDYLDTHPVPDIKVVVRVEEEILGTGGGIRNTADFWGEEPFVVLNGDVLTNVNITRAYEHHLETGALATLVLHDQPPYNKIRLGKTGLVSEIPADYGSEGLAFTGIHIMWPAIVAHIPDGFSDIVDCYRRLIRSGEPIGSYVSRGHYWRDIGNLADYVTANRELAPTPFTTGPGCEIPGSAKWIDWAVLGERCSLGEGAEVSRSVLWDGVRLEAGVSVRDSVVTSNTVLDQDLEGAVL